MNSVVTGWIVSLITTLSTSAEDEATKREMSTKKTTVNRDSFMGSAAAALSPRAGLLRALFGRSYGRRFNLVPSYAPSGLRLYVLLHPRLSPWAAFLRRFAAWRSGSRFEIPVRRWAVRHALRLPAETVSLSSCCLTSVQPGNSLLPVIRRAPRS